MSWAGEPIEDTYGGKAVLDWKGEPVFAELAILRALEEDGWEGVWVDTFGGLTFRSGFRDRPAATLPESQQILYDRIASESEMSGGCWAVLAWKEGHILFAESKRAHRDAIRPNQLHWLQAALNAGTRAEAFLVLEWELAEHAP